ncbi:MAG: hypothetical protein BJ554DRAFT_462 [Olpidium bornovanus]|uniref:Protein-S-isoprenylcysteine O-methyltransferase n=1 Tax=Olpidium bornovanus TaxID=278681 RepID=A0A8H7ZTX3_9FUNG|nr:MAG: hypothetical protein BJ554DRAFT_462 [Olpidium bornovanus]
MMANPVCTVIYAGVLHRFFSRRIAWEEETLVNFFGEDYSEYRAATPTLMPGIP